MSVIFAPSTFRIVRGATWSDTFQLADAGGAPVNLTGVDDIVMRVRSAITASTVLLELSVDNDRLIITDAPEGQVSILVSAEDTLAFPVNRHSRARYIYDAVIDRGGTPQVIEPCIKGWLSVDPQVTRLLSEP